MGGRRAVRWGGTLGLALLASALGATWSGAAESVSLGGSPALDARGPALLLDRWSIAEGLPQNSILDIAQDEAGHLWLATFAGLARFDGTDFLVLDIAAVPALPSNQVTAVLPAEDGKLWLATVGDGVVRLAGGRVESVLPPARSHGEAIALARDRAGALWLRETSGALRRWEGEHWVEVLPPATAATRQSLYGDGEGSIWASDGRRLLRFDGSGAVAASWTAGSPVLSLGGGAGPDSPLWLGLEDGVARLVSGGIERLPVEPPLDQEVTAVLADGSDALFVALADGTLRRLARSAGAAWSRGEPIATLAPGGAWRSLARDREGGLWLGTDGEGLLRLQAPRVAVLGLGGRAAPATALATDGAGGAWAAFGCEGLGHAAGPAGPFTPIALPPSESGENCVHSLLRDASGRLWIGRREEVLRRTADGADFAVPLRFPGDEGGPLAEVPPGIWIGTRSGRLVRLDPRDRVVEEIDLGSPINSLAAGSDGALWIGLKGALVRHEGGRTRRWGAADGVRAGTVRDILAGRDAGAWIASYGGGLGLLSADRVSWVTRDHGLPDNGVTRILPDEQGRLWLLTNRGIAVAAESQLVEAAGGRRSTVDFVAYGAEAGMPEGNYGYPAGFRGDDGRVWFDSIKGVATLDASRFPFHRAVPEAAIDQVEADGRLLAAGDPTIVPAGTNHVEIRYSAPDLSMPEGVRFRHRLAGFDRWTVPSSRRRATYARLPPGDFAFELLVRNADGVWAPAPAVRRLRVLPAWWQTWLARVAFVAAAIAAAAALHQARTRAIRRRGEALLLESEARRAAEERASRLRGQLEHLQRVATVGQLTAALAHELNQPLTAIVANAAAGARIVDPGQPRGGDLAAILDDISALGRRTSSVIGGMRRLMKKEEPARRPLDTNEVVTDTLQLARGELARQGIEVELALAPDLPPVMADRIQLQQVLINLINNAGEAMAGWTGARRLTVATAREGTSVRIDVLDTGPGLPAEVAAQAFEPFVTTKREGMGMGLAICRAVVDVNGGRIEHVRPASGGALFRLHLPVADTEARTP